MALAALLMLNPPLPAVLAQDDDGPQASGRMIRVGSPIRGNADARVKRKSRRAIEELRKQAGPDPVNRPILILHLDAREGEAGRGSEFERALSLARFLTGSELAGVKTVAYIPRTIQGHAVLVAMACDEIIMWPDAEIGAAGADADPNEPIDETFVVGYEQIAACRQTVPAAIALGMLDRRLEVLRVETEDGTQFVLRRDLDELKKTKTLKGEPEVVFGRGELGNLSGRKGRDLGVVAYLADDARGVAEALNVPVDSVREDPWLAEEIKPRRIDISGAIDGRMQQTRQRMIDDALRDEANYICFWIDSDGGEAQAASLLAGAIARLDPAKVRTVAYIPHEARGVSAVVALACDEIVMHSGAALGGEEENIDQEGLKDVVTTIRDEIAHEKKRTWSLPAALVDPKLAVYRYTNAQSGREEYFSPVEAGDQENKDDWKRGRQIVEEGKALTVLGPAAVEFGLARDTVEDFDQFKTLQGLDEIDSFSEPSWAEDAVKILANPRLSWLLLMIGITAMYAELNMPGIGIGGFIAALAFVLFFWANYLDRTANELEIVLFLVGVTFLVLEVFVIPGFGIFGLGGGLLVIVSLVLASQTFVLPTKPTELRAFRDSLLVVGGAGVGFIAAAMVIRRYLPHAPLFNRVMLQPPSDEQLGDLSRRESMVDFEHLVGARGTTTTQLTPSGKARFQNELIDVISDGELIPQGTPIEIAEVHGNRVIVRAVD